MAGALTLRCTSLFKDPNIVIFDIFELISRIIHNLSLDSVGASKIKHRTQIPGQ